MIDCEFYCNYNNIEQIICRKLYDICAKTQDFIFVFIGTDANIGDSLAPICGEMIDFSKYNCLAYGNLKNIITAKDIPYLKNYLTYAHPSSLVISVDAALGDKDDVGLIKVCKSGLKPGLGVNKDLPVIGDASIIAVVGEKQPLGKLSNVLRLGNIYKTAGLIASGITAFLDLKTRSSEYLNIDKYYIEEL